MKADDCHILITDYEPRFWKGNTFLSQWNTFFSLCVFSPLTKVKLINELNEREASLGVNESVSWHSEYKDSAWIFVGETAWQTE